MSPVEEVWYQKSDEDLFRAIEGLHERTPSSREEVLAEAARRGLVVDAQPRCPSCGARIEIDHNHTFCAFCRQRLPASLREYVQAWLLWREQRMRAEG
jgi:hypothetical protein